MHGEFPRGNELAGRSGCRPPLWEGRPDYQHCLCTGSRKLNDFHDLRIASGVGVGPWSRALESGLAATARSGKFDGGSIRTYMWDTLEKEPSPCVDQLRRRPLPPPCLPPPPLCPCPPRLLPRRRGGAIAARRSTS